jgi:hypothetical protein
MVGMTDPPAIDLARPLLDLILHFQADWESLNRFFSAPYSPKRRDRLRALLTEWRDALDAMPFETLPLDQRADWILFRNHLDGEARLLDREERQLAEMAPLLPFLPDLVKLEDDRRALGLTHPPSIADRLDEAANQARRLQEEMERAKEQGGALPRPFTANRAAQAIDRVLTALEGWHTFHHGYDPLFNWWVEQPYAALRETLTEYAAFLREGVAGAEDGDAIIGDAIGREGLREELERNLIPYSPEELIEIGRREREWCMAELLRAAGEMGYGEDWRGALEQVKTDHAAPGFQPALVRDLAQEAVRFLRDRDLVTIPAVAEECWRMEMMPPEKQKVNPFFLGGEEIIVSFPTHDMEHARKRMSQRGNNRHFSRATVQHELIPGHHLQMHHQDRYRPYRRLFYTPFWTEGWTLHWEMLLWDLGFPRTAPERIGMLFWRLHRCARVEFSLGFHLGTMTAQECVEMLVNDVGHERDNAEAEVRRSFGGDYDALYQAAYLIGGLQVRALHRELVGGGRMTHRQFHDAMLRENCMPIALLRELLHGRPPDREFSGDWRFYES